LRLCIAAKTENCNIVSWSITIKIIYKQ
jgi:hypothetical protein